MEKYLKKIEKGLFDNSFRNDKNIFEKIYLNLMLPITALKEV